MGELVVVLALVKVYDYVRSLAAEREPLARGHGEHLLSAERLLDLDWEHAGNHWLAGHRTLGLAAAYWYQFAHIGVTLTVLVCCYVAQPSRYRPARNALVVTNLVGMAVFFTFPVMPPRLLPGGGFTDSVAAAGFGSEHGGPIPADQFAAMPSLHLAWATWTGLVAAGLLSNKLARTLCHAYPVATALVVVVTANHYVLDVVAGVVVALAAVWTTSRRAVRQQAASGGTGSGGTGSGETDSAPFRDEREQAAPPAEETGTVDAITGRLPSPP
ncbi:phosphatase PAP2 family protein [Actinomadura barringtoniae]|uniref:Phosphatase PAP2 family protein n=1 Tax=Actinomadura barringtoniae TaxID=1427535 RepID=A0A939T509_9ACTN|nr:phosphatase PAP2 family protein [Actinomadura barringtoniae]MBO2453201.1 phosphatase PAP2 family protein [Actinomadura barringtoniae]